MQHLSPRAQCITSASTLGHQHLLSWLWLVQTSPAIWSSSVHMANRQYEGCHRFTASILVWTLTKGVV